MGKSQEENFYFAKHCQSRRDKKFVVTVMGKTNPFSRDVPFQFYKANLHVLFLAQEKYQKNMHCKRIAEIHSVPLKGKNSVAMLLQTTFLS